MSHWYLPDGSPFHYQKGKDGKFQKGKDGKLKPTTMWDIRREAKKGVYPAPSVTSVESVISAPGLIRWKIDQAIEIAQGTTLSAPEIHVEMSRRLEERAQLGTNAHGVLEAYFKGDTVSPLYAQLGARIQYDLELMLGKVEWEAEKTFYDSRGFGGCADLVCPLAVVDFKTTEKELDKLGEYDNHGRQLAAYREGLGLHEAQMYIVFVQLETSGEAAGSPTGKYCIIGHGHGDRRFGEFLAALALWKATKNYYLDEQPLRDRISELYAENKRLRKALENIQTEYPFYDADKPMEIARKALEDKV